METVAHAGLQRTNANDDWDHHGELSNSHYRTGCPKNTKLGLLVKGIIRKSVEFSFLV